MHEMRHPNVMPLYCSFVHGEQLWMIMPHVAGGSLFNVMQTSFPQVGLSSQSPPSSQWHCAEPPPCCMPAPCVLPSPS